MTKEELIDTVEVTTFNPFVKTAMLALIEKAYEAGVQDERERRDEEAKDIALERDLLT